MMTGLLQDKNLRSKVAQRRFSGFWMRWLLPLTLIVGFAFVDLAHGEGVARVYSAQGTVESQADSGADWNKVSKGDAFNEGDQIRTGKNSRAGLKFSGGKLVRLRETSVLKIRKPVERGERKGRLSLLSGVAHLFSKKSKDFPEVETPEVSAAIRGTEFVIEVTPGRSTFTVLNGMVALTNQFGSVQLTAGEQGIATKGAAPSKALLVSPEDAVQWTLHYPAVVHMEDYAQFVSGANDRQSMGIAALKDGELGTASHSFSGSAWRDVMGRALIDYQEGDVAGAIEELSTIKGSSADADLLRAALYLSVGKVEEARGVFGEVKTSLSGVDRSHRSRLEAVLNSQMAVVDVVTNQRDKAMAHSQAAVQLAPNSVTASVVRAYVHQSRAELGLAEEWLLKALELDPENSFALARLAEIKLGSGHLSDGIETASRAVELSPGNAHALGVLGFAHLTKFQTEKAKEYFGKALTADDTNSMNYLGLGLAKIREGDLEAGREDLEKAVALAPSTSIYRSYLGKAFFEEEEEDLAAAEYDIAVDLDPNDPTPYLYRAFNRLSRNEVVGALEDVENSIELNDNRAVYRSQFMLDQDIGVRSSSLAEVFQQLGFSQVSRLEALKSLNSDYSNYSAHRLLADSLEGDFFADARFTENILADILAPLSFNVFQDLRGFSGGASLNEYTALFDRPEHRTGLGASWLTEADEATGNVFQTGREGNIGYFAGFRTLYGRGSKSNGDFLREQRFDLAGQYQVDYANRVILQSAFTSFDDRFVEDGGEIDDFEISLSSNHKFGPHSELLTRFEYFDRDADAYEYGVGRTAEENIKRDGMEEFLGVNDLLIDSETEEDFWSLRYSGQYIYDSEYVSFVAGGEYFDSQADAEEDSIILEDSLGTFTGLDRELDSRGEYDADSYKGYLYTKWHFGRWADADIGVNYTDVELPEYDVIAPYIDGERSEDQWSPKFGLTLYPTGDTTLRGTYYETLGISSVSDIGSIEPTFVGSFQQNFGDLPGAQVETYGVGLDHKLPKLAYVGAEYMHRDISRDGVTISNSLTLDLDTVSDLQGFSQMIDDEEEREELIRSYLYIVLGKRFTATVDYLRTDLKSLDISEVNETDQLAFGLNYFDPSQWFAFTRGTWRQQDLENVSDFDDGKNDFWVVDLGIGYRIPKRHGSIQLVLNNILDESFEFADRGREESFDPDFSARIEASVNF